MTDRAGVGQRLLRSAAAKPHRRTALAAARPGEARGARWSEIDLAKGVWSLPAERMKAREPHQVPLSSQAIAILRRRLAFRIEQSDYVFANDGKKPLSDVAVAKALRGAGVKGYTIHGFRSSFTDWPAEKTSFPKEVADKALDHRIPNPVEAAYRRTDFFDKRRALMTQWADFLYGVGVFGDIPQITNAALPT